MGLLDDLQRKYPESFIELDPNGYVPTLGCQHNCKSCDDGECRCSECKAFGTKKTHPWTCGHSKNCSFFEQK